MPEYVTHCLCNYWITLNDIREDSNNCPECRRSLSTLGIQWQNYEELQQEPEDAWQRAKESAND